MFLLYAAYRFAHPMEFHEAAAELSVPLGVANTAVLLTSSLSMALSVAAIQRGEQLKSVFFVCTTVILGSAFLVVKYFEWGAKFHHGIYPGSPELLDQPHGIILFFGLYFVMTGLHGIHVLVGVVLLAVMAVWVARGKVRRDRYMALENSGLYWHLVDIIWIFLLPLFYLTT
jgi:cytochrome c oxidase subunit 3